MEIILPLYNFELQDDIIAGVSRGKGQDLFLRAFYESLLLIKEKKLQVPSLHAVVVGSDMNAHTKLEKELRQFVMEKKIQDRVHFVNKTLAVAPYLASIDVLVQNSQVSTDIYSVELIMKRIYIAFVVLKKESSNITAKG